MTKSQQTQAVYLLPLTDSGAPDVPGQYIYLPPPTDPPAFPHNRHPRCLRLQLSADGCCSLNVERAVQGREGRESERQRQVIVGLRAVNNM